jgi:hypothetical protein
MATIASSKAPRSGFIPMSCSRVLSVACCCPGLPLRFRPLPETAALSLAAPGRKGGEVTTDSMHDFGRVARQNQSEHRRFVPGYRVAGRCAGGRGEVILRLGASASGKRHGDGAVR